MVVLQLHPLKGNHTRSFPFSGHLGLTQVVVEGIIRTTLEEDLKPIKTAQILVRLRCYQEDCTGSKPKKFVLKEVVQEIWKAENEEWGMIGDFARPFKLVLPIDYGACGGTVVYKDLKMYWKVEAVLYHKVIPMQGCRKIVSHLVPLVDFSLPNLTLPIPTWSSPLNLGSRGLHYKITCSPTRGPDELFQILVDIKKEDFNILVKKVQFSLDRTITILGDHYAAGAISSSDCDDSIINDGEEEEERLGRPLKKRISPFKRSASTPSSPMTSNSLSSPEPEYRNNTVGGKSTSNIFSVEKVDLNFDGNGLMSTSIDTLVPRQKSLYKYSYGESSKTKFAIVEFALTVKIIIKTKNNGSETIELEPKAIRMMASSAEDRDQANLNTHKSLLGVELSTSLYQPSISSIDSSISLPSTPVRITSPRVIVLEKSHRQRREGVNADSSRRRGESESHSRRSKSRSEKSDHTFSPAIPARTVLPRGPSSPDPEQHSTPSPDLPTRSGKFPLANQLESFSSRRSPRIRVARRPYSAASRTSTSSKRSFEDSEINTRRLRIEPESSPPLSFRSVYETPPPFPEKDNDGDIKFSESFAIAPFPVSDAPPPPVSPSLTLTSFSLSRSASTTFHAGYRTLDELLIDPLEVKNGTWSSTIIPTRASTSAGTTSSFGSSYALDFNLDQNRSQTISPTSTTISLFGETITEPHYGHKLHGRRKSSLVALLRNSSKDIVNNTTVIQSPIQSPTAASPDSRWSFLKRSGKT